MPVCHVDSTEGEVPAADTLIQMKRCATSVVMMAMADARQACLRSSAPREGAERSHAREITIAARTMRGGPKYGTSANA